MKGARLLNQTGKVAKERHPQMATAESNTLRQERDQTPSPVTQKLPEKERQAMRGGVDLNL